MGKLLIALALGAVAAVVLLVLMATGFAIGRALYEAGIPSWIWFALFLWVVWSLKAYSHIKGGSE